jgi:glycosyltransferase involved in cell wall biosynthesis
MKPSDQHNQSLSTLDERMSAPGPSGRSAIGLSVCMIARNEAPNIGESLASVIGWASEVIVVDCESGDGTGEIARRMGARVSVRPNDPNLNVNKNASFDLAGEEWILCLDADESIPDELKREIELTISGRPAQNGFKIPRRNFYFGVPLLHGGNYPDFQLRLFRRGRGRFPERHVHERIAIDGPVGELKNPFDHLPYPGFDVWLRKFDFYTGVEATQLESRGIPINARTIRHYMITRPLRRWLERLFLKRGIKDGVPGVLAATFDLMTNVVAFGKYWERKKV